VIRRRRVRLAHIAWQWNAARMVNKLGRHHQRAVYHHATFASASLPAAVVLLPRKFRVVLARQTGVGNLPNPTPNQSNQWYSPRSNDLDDARWKPFPEHSTSSGRRFSTWSHGSPSSSATKGAESAIRLVLDSAPPLRGRGGVRYAAITSGSAIALAIISSIDAVHLEVANQAILYPALLLCGGAAPLFAPYIVMPAAVGGAQLIGPIIRIVFGPRLHQAAELVPYAAFQALAIAVVQVALTHYRLTVRSSAVTANFLAILLVAYLPFPWLQSFPHPVVSN
jgi:hypothetical protein